MAGKSFDIGPTKKVPVKPARRATREPKKKKESSHPRLATRSPKKKLRDRKRDAFMRNLTLTAFALVLLAGATVYVLWLPSLRIQSAEAAGTNENDPIAAIALADMRGSYAGMIPKNSFFFYPVKEIRSDILDRYPEIAAVSLQRSGFTSLSITTSPRVPAFWWCGAPSSLAAEDVTCYDADTEGLVFRRADTSASTTEKNMLHVYADLATGSSTPAEYPVKERVVGSDKLPAILQFAHFVQGMNITIASVAIRGDEADLFVAPATRITYIVGHEKQAEEAAKAAFPTLSLTDGSIDYVDLRFDGKVYLKRVGE